jgi:DNA-binding NtrC family response regulator
MRILICKPSAYIADELTEYFRGLNWEADIAAEPGLIYQSLSRHKYDLSLYYVSSLDDFAQIRYINDNYPETKVIVSADPALGSAIENVRKGSYESLCYPILPNDLGKCLESNNEHQNMKLKKEK